jgi:hypothetical protein
MVETWHAELMSGVFHHSIYENFSLFNVLERERSILPKYLCCSILDFKRNLQLRF